MSVRDYFRLSRRALTLCLLAAGLFFASHAQRASAQLQDPPDCTACDDNFGPDVNDCYALYPLPSQQYQLLSCIADAYSGYIGCVSENCNTGLGTYDNTEHSYCALACDRQFLHCARGNYYNKAGYDECLSEGNSPASCCEGQVTYCWDDNCVPF